MSISIDVEVDIADIEKRFGTVNFNRARYAMANQMLDDMHKHIPNRDGKLSASGHASRDGATLTWSTPYARAQFYGMVGRAPGHRVRHYTKSKVPEPGRRWDLIGKMRYMPRWQNTMKKELGL